MCECACEQARPFCISQNFTFPVAMPARGLISLLQYLSAARLLKTKSCLPNTTSLQRLKYTKSYNLGPMQGRGAFKTYQHHTHVCVCLSVFDIKFHWLPKRTRRGRHVCGSTGISIIQHLRRSSSKQVSPTWEQLLFAISITSKMQQSRLMWSTAKPSQNPLPPPLCLCVCLSERGPPFPTTWKLSLKPPYICHAIPAAQLLKTYRLPKYIYDLYLLSQIPKEPQSRHMWSRAEQLQNLPRSSACVVLSVCLSREVLPLSP